MLYEVVVLLDEIVPTVFELPLLNSIKVPTLVLLFNIKGPAPVPLFTNLKI